MESVEMDLFFLKNLIDITASLSIKYNQSVLT
jgi:hypothetical protein